MGLWTQISAIWNPRASIQATIEAQVASYNAQRLAHGDRDHNAWLAEALKSRIGWSGHPDIWYYSNTAQFSLAREPAATLGLYVLYKEAPDLAATQGDVFAMLMDPVYELMQRGSFVRTWKNVNAWTARRYPELEGGLEVMATNESGMAL